MKQIDSAFLSRLPSRSGRKPQPGAATQVKTESGVGMDSNLRSSGSASPILRALAARFTFVVAALATSLAATTLVTLPAPPPAAAQASYTAQLSGTVSASSGGVIPGAKVT